MTYEVRFETDKPIRYCMSAPNDEDSAICPFFDAGDNWECAVVPGRSEDHGYRDEGDRMLVDPPAWCPLRIVV